MRIPVKIIRVDTGEHVRNVVTFNSADFFSLDDDAMERIKRFENLYSEVIRKISAIKGGKYDSLPSSKYHELGAILRDFNGRAESEFEIKNYNASVSRDFGLSKDYICDLVTIADTFKRSEILDSVPFSYYRALKRKRGELEGMGLFGREKKRLNAMGRKGTLPGREKYKKELVSIIDGKRDNSHPNSVDKHK